MTTSSDRADLVLANMDLARQVAFSTRKRINLSLDIDDMISEALVRLITCAREWNGKESFRGFAMQRIRWALIDWARNQRPGGHGVLAGKLYHLPPEEAEIALSRLPSPDQPPDEAADTRRSKELVERLMQPLTHVQRYVLRRHYMEGAGYAVIGTEIGRTESRAHQIGKEAIRKILESPARGDAPTSATSRRKRG